MHCATIEKRDGGPSRAEIEAELQQIRVIQAKDPMARDQATGEYPVAKVYRTLQTGEPLSAKKTTARWHRVEETVCQKGGPPHSNRQCSRDSAGAK